MLLTIIVYFTQVSKYNYQSEYSSTHLLLVISIANGRKRVVRELT
jgi:hypothetical protein